MPGRHRLRVVLAMPRAGLEARVAQTVQQVLDTLQAVLGSEFLLQMRRMSRSRSVQTPSAAVGLSLPNAGGMPFRPLPPASWPDPAGLRSLQTERRLRHFPPTSRTKRKEGTSWPPAPLMSTKGQPYISRGPAAKSGWGCGGSRLWLVAERRGLLPWLCSAARRSSRQAWFRRDAVNSAPNWPWLSSTPARY